MAVNCGVDIIEIDRVRTSFEKCGDSFRNKVFTIKEIEYCENRHGARFESYAARFAAKEAVSKAFGTGMGKDIGWKDIETLNDGSGKPYIVLSEKGKMLFSSIKGISISVSLSHSHDTAIAFAIIETM